MTADDRTLVDALRDHATTLEQSTSQENASHARDIDQVEKARALAFKIDNGDASKEDKARVAGSSAPPTAPPGSCSRRPRSRAASAAPTVSSYASKTEARSAPPPGPVSWSGDPFPRRSRGRLEEQPHGAGLEGRAVGEPQPD